MTYYTAQNGNIAVCIDDNGRLYIGSDQSLATRHALFRTQAEAEAAVEQIWPKGVLVYYITSEVRQ